MTLATLQATLELARRHGRVCPRPDDWCALYELLPRKRGDMYGPIPASPLVLGAWESTTDEDKRRRLREHLEWAEQYGAIHEVHAFLSLLPEARWHHAGG